MNRERRKQISIITSELQSLINSLDVVKQDEEFAFDSMPEGLQCSERGEKSEEAIQLMDDALEQLDRAYEYLSDIY